VYLDRIQISAEAKRKSRLGRSRTDFNAVLPDAQRIIDTIRMPVAGLPATTSCPDPFRAHVVCGSEWRCS